MRIVVQTEGGKCIRVNDRNGRGISLNQGDSSIRFSNEDALALFDAVTAVVLDNRRRQQVRQQGHTDWDARNRQGQPCSTKAS